MLAGKLIAKIDKFGMWILLALVLSFIFTGYGMTKHVMDPVLAKYIHTHILPIPLLIFFCVHVLKAVRNQFKKWNVFSSELAVDIYAFSLTFIVIFILIWLYFQ